MLMIPSDFALSRELRLTAWMKSQRLNGSGRIMLEAWGDGAVATGDTSAILGHTYADSEQEWTQHELEIVVPSSDVHTIVIAAGLEGSGTIWFDDLQLYAAGQRISSLPPDAPSPTDEDLAWLRRHASPLHSVSPASPDDLDLTRFRDVVGSARIVALGESTHGTSEFFVVKHRLLEYLVCELGFTVFAIEANQLAVERINRYVQGGEGAAREVMRVMFAVWNTEEMRALIEWMRAHNRDHPDRMVRFAGFDMQDHEAPADTLRAFLQRCEPSLVMRFDSLLGEYCSQPGSATPQIPDSIRTRWRKQGETMWQDVSARRSAWLVGARSRGDSIAAEWALQSANLMRQATLFNEALNSPERDSLMAANLDWIVRILAPGERAVVWAHDVHVSRGGDPERSFNGGAQMGAYLSRLYGDGYRAFSLLTYDGAYSATKSFTDHEWIEAAAFPAPAGSIEEALHRLPRTPGAVGMIVDLRAAASDNRGDWLWQPRPIRHIGYAAYDYGFEMKAVPPLEFDGIVFIDHTTASRKLR